MIEDPDLEASWATKPSFYHAPHPANVTPRQYQLAGVEYHLARNNALFGDAPGLGKAQPLSSLVRVPGGWKRMGDIKAGDGVCGYDGKGGRVVGVYDRGVRDVYEVTFSDGAKTRVSEDHLWRAQTPKARWFIAPTWMIAEKMKTSKVWIPLTAPVGSAQGTWLPVDPYLVGLLLGDGGLSGGGVMLSTADEEIVAFCKAQAARLGLNLVPHGKYDYRFSADRPGQENKLLDKLRELGLMGWRSPEKEIPDRYKYTGASNRLALLRGLMDSDGWVSGGVTGFSSSSQQLALGVQELVQSLGGVARWSQKISASGKWAFTLTISMEHNPFRLRRKAELWVPHKKYKPKRLFKSIEYVGREEVRCIEVTCADRLYLTDEYIVTHNTPESIMLDNAIESRRTLVVCPASLRLNWEREVWRWSMKPNVRTYPIRRSKDGVSPEADFVIVSYDLLRDDDLLRALLDLRWDHLILDEAHYLKDPKGNKRTKAICAPDALPSAVGRITMASGTILPNQPIEVYNAIRLLDWETINKASLEDFRENYYEFGSGFITGKYQTTDEKGNPVVKYGPHWSDQVRNVPRNLDDLRERLRKRVMVRRLKEHVLTELPKKQWHVVPLESTPGIKRALKHEGWKAAEKLYEMDPEAFDGGVPIDGAISTARRLLGEEKAPLVADYVEELLIEGARKVVVAAWHLSVLSILREKLKQHGLVYMDGSTSNNAKQEAVDRFQGDDDVRVMLGQMMPLGMGWTLTEAQDVVLAEPDWVPGRNDQMLDRVHRYGQAGEYVIGHVPVVPGSLDERVLSTAIEKDVSIHRALDGSRK